MTASAATTPDALDVLTRLLSDGSAATRRVSAGPDWSVPAPRPDGPARIVVWAGPGVTRGGPPALLRNVARRELALLRLRARRARGGREVLRTAPPVTRAGAGAGLRRWLAGGLVVRLTADPGELAAAGAGSVLARIAHEAGLDGTGRPGSVTAGLRLRAGSGGAVLAFAGIGGRPVVLRVGADGGPGDPRPAAAALARLAGLGVQAIPAVRARGRTDGLGWSVETRLPGSVPARLTPDLLEALVDFCAALPPSGRAPEVPPLVVAFARAHLPQLLEDCRRAQDAIGAVTARLPGTAGHGDLWTGNLLVDGGRLSGVIDWDAAAESTVPGADLLHAIGTADRLGSRRSLGAELLARPWREPAAAAALRRYWDRLGLQPSARDQDVLALAWWARQVTSDVARLPHLGQDERWLATNVRQVLAGWRSS